MNDGARLPAWAPLLVLGLAWIAQGGALAGPWRHDDRVVLAAQGEPGARPSVRTALDPSAWAATLEPEAWRPAASLSLALEAPLWEDADPDAAGFGFRATNLFLHGVAALLLLAVLRVAVRGPAGASVAFAGAAVFAAHPTQVGTVASLAGRADLLAAVFALGAALAWFAAHGPGRRAWLPVAAVLYLLALLSKETAVGLPLVLLLLAAGAREGWSGLPRWAPGSPARRMATVAVFLVPLVAWALLVADALPGPRAPGAEARAVAGAGGMGHAALRIALPVALVEDPAPPEAGAEASAYDRSAALVACLLTALAAVLALGNLARLGASAWLAFAALAVPAALVAAVPGGARFAYVPQVALFVVAGALLVAVLRASVPRAVGVAGAAVGLVALVVLSRAEATTWTHPAAYEQAVLRNEPDNPRPLVRLARAAREAAEDGLARAMGMRADAPEHTRLVQRARQDLERAEHSARAALSIPEGRRSPAAWAELGAVLLAQREHVADAVQALERSLELHPLTALADASGAPLAAREELSQTYWRLGIANEALGDLDPAAFRFESAARVRPDDLRRVERAGDALVRVHAYGRALEWFERAERLARSPEARTRLSRKVDELRRAAVNAGEQRLREARRAEAEGEDGVRRASDLYEQALLADPTLIEAWLGAAKLRGIVMGDHRSAGALLDGAERQLATFRGSRRDEFLREVERLRKQLAERDD